MNKTTKAKGKKSDLIIPGVVLVLITWGVGSCIRDNNRFSKSRSRWNKCSAWIVKFESPYGGNSFMPSYESKAWFAQNCEQHTARKMPKRDDKSTWYLEHSPE